MLKLWLLFVISLLSMDLHAKPITIDDSELHRILNELHAIRQQLNSIQNTLDNPDVNGRYESNEAYTVWGCYMKDISAGGVYGTGLTEAEAKGMALEKCSSKNGACFESTLKCSQNK